MNKQKNSNFINKFWDEQIVTALKDFIKIPNKSPHFDPNWQANGHMLRAASLLHAWCKKHAIDGMSIDVVQVQDKTPVLLIEIPGNNDKTILLYGHMDKQPEMAGWENGLEPWKPVLRGEKLYGRGGADDGYAVFAAMAAIKSVHEQGLPHARCIILIEACEESASYDLPFYIENLNRRIGSPDLIICLDSTCGNYDQLWVATSLRGLVAGTLRIGVLKEGVHSGLASGIVPSCFLVLRQLLERIEDSLTGKVLLQGTEVCIPMKRQQQAALAASVLGSSFYGELPFLTNVQPVSTCVTDSILSRTWRSALSVVGSEGFPSIQNAGNVALPSIAIKLSMRLPPTCRAETVAKSLKTVLESDPPYQANVSFNVNEVSDGWDAPSEKPWLSLALNQASIDYFGKEVMYMGAGGTIAFMGMLGRKFPNAQFLVTGLLGPLSNAHGPNEFLDIPTGKKLTACIAQIISDHYYSEE